MIVKKLKYEKKAQLCYMNINNMIVHIKTEEIYIDIAKDVETRFIVSNYVLHMPLRRENCCIRTKNILLFNK